MTVETPRPPAETTPDFSRQGGEPMPLRPRELGRWAWRQLTSMRTALVLLFLLALAAVPGSLVPQTSIDPGRVAQFVQAHPTLGAVYSRLGLFEVYRSPWFAAIYLLLFTSLVGCVLPRVRVHAAALRVPPPAAPRNLGRLPAYRRWVVSDPAAEVAESAAARLRARRMRVVRGPADSPAGRWVAAEGGYLRETGNLVFHLALLLILFSVAAGGLFGWKANVIVPVGSGFADTVSQYDSFNSGPYVNVAGLPPFSIDLRSLRVTYQTSGQQIGAPRSFVADIGLRPQPGAPTEAKTITVNHPLDLAGTKVFLTGNGYAPVITVRDAKGHVAFSGPVPFLPRDGNMTSTGVVKVPDISPSQIGVTALFLPTALIDPVRGPISIYPDLKNPELFLGVYSGDLGIDSGKPTSVYQLDTSKMKLQTNGRLTPGQTLTLPNNLGSISFDGIKRYANFQIAYDPGRIPVLIGAVLAIAGLLLSLFVRRRRVWVRATEDGSGRTVIELAGLARSESAFLDEEIEEITGELSAHLTATHDEE